MLRLAIILLFSLFILKSADAQKIKDASGTAFFKLEEDMSITPSSMPSSGNLAHTLPRNRSLISTMETQNSGFSVKPLSAVNGSKPPAKILVKKSGK